MRKYYRIHKWIAVSVGVFIFAQAVTGAVWVGPNPVGAPAWRHATVPADAEVELVRPLDVCRPLGDVEQVALRWLPGTPVYEVALPTGEARLFDARDGSPLEVGEDLAVRIAKHAVSGTGDAQVARTTRLTEPDVAFMGGPLPSYRVEMADAGATYVHVAGATGRVVSVVNRWDRARGVLTATHTWGLVWLWTGSSRLARLGLILAACVVCLAVLSGYYLALPKRRPVRRNGPRATRAVPPPQVPEA